MAIRLRGGELVGCESTSWWRDDGNLFISSGVRRGRKVFQPKTKEYPKFTSETIDLESENNSTLLKFYWIEASVR